MIAYIGYWLASEVPEKKRLINECWRLTKESLKAFEEAGEAWQYGRTYNQLSSSIVFGFCLEWNFQAREKLIREAVEYGEQAIKFLSSTEDPLNLQEPMQEQPSIWQFSLTVSWTLTRRKRDFRKLVTTGRGPRRHLKMWP